MKKALRIITVALLLISIVITASFVLWCGHSSVPQSLGSVRVNIETYLAGQNQPTHPSVVTFPEEWNGARFWLAYSPYPYGNGEEENPCLAISDDLFYWECPSGLANPIADNEETGCNELKDPHLLYRNDLDRLEMWYLGRLAEDLGGDGKSLLLMRKCSLDGVNWTNYEVMASTKYLSPTISWDGGKYQMWSIGYDLWNTTGTVVYQESLDGISWTEPVCCSVGDKQSNIDIWHGSVVVYDGKYHLVFVDNSDKQEIFYCSGIDGIHFSEPDIIIENEGYWDFLYRPTLVYDGDTISCLYGVINQENQWYISASAGKDVYHLVGVSEPQTAAMIHLPDEVIDTHSVRYKIKNLYGAIRTYLRPELLAFVILESALLVVIKNLRRNKSIVALCTCANCLASLAYICIRLYPTTFVSWLGAFWAICCLNVGMWAVLKCIYLSMNEEKTQ